MRNPALARATLLAGALSIVSATTIATTAARAAQDQRTPEAIALQTAIERGCLPALTNGASALDHAAGVLHDDTGPYVPAGPDERARIQPPDSMNPTVCTITLRYKPGERAGMDKLLNAWAADNHLTPLKVNEVDKGQQHIRITSTWSGRAAHGQMALVFSAEQMPGGGALTDGRKLATVLVSVTPS